MRRRNPNPRPVTRARLEEQLRDYTGQEIFRDDDRLCDVGLDSLDAVSLVMWVEDETARTINDADLEALVTVGDLVELCCDEAVPA